MEKKLRVDIFHISEFGGHSQAAHNIKEAILAKQDSAEAVNLNSFQYFYPRTEKVVNFIYTLVIKKIPSLWGKAYNRKTLIKYLMPWRQVVSLISFPRLHKYIKTKKPDCFVTTQAFPCGLIADYKKIYKSKIPLVAAITDFYPHRFWIHPFIDKYLVASGEAKQALIDEGVEAEKIFVTGIPISIKFAKSHPREAVADQFGFSRRLKAVLVMGGGLGIGPIEQSVFSLDKIEHEFQIIVVCGRNKFLYKKLKKKKGKIKKPLFVFKYTDSIDKIMDFADIIITKAGGITISESLAKSMAIIVTSPIPGQEEFNVDFLIRKNAILKANTPLEIQKSVASLFEDKEKLEFLKRKAWENSFGDSSIKIADLVFQLTQK